MPPEFATPAADASSVAEHEEMLDRALALQSPLLEVAVPGWRAGARRGKVPEAFWLRADFEEIVAKLLAQRFARGLKAGQSTPAAERGWRRMHSLFAAALSDPEIAASPPAVGLLTLLIEVVGVASDERQVKDKIGSTLAAERAASKNLEARTWVQAEWRCYKADYEGHKAAFARDYRARLRNERGVNITERTIAGRWLNGC